MIWQRRSLRNYGHSYEAGSNTVAEGDEASAHAGAIHAQYGPQGKACGGKVLPAACYHSPMFKITFTAAEQAFSTAGAALSVAESHGCLAGALCVQGTYSLDKWLEEVLPDGVAAAQSDSLREPLAAIFEDTVRALSAGDMEFAPLLPDDEVPLTERAEALAQWSQGFLYGFGVGRSAQLKESLAEVEEVLRDIAEISRASSQDLSGNEEEEQAYSELVEYVRAGTQLIHDELFAQRTQQQIH